MLQLSPLETLHYSSSPAFHVDTTGGFFISCRCLRSSNRFWLLPQLMVKYAARRRNTFFSYVVSGSGRIMFSLIYFSAGEQAWLQVDLSALPYKEDFGSALWAATKAAAGPHWSTQKPGNWHQTCIPSDMDKTRKQTTSFMLSLQSWRPLSELEREASSVDDGKPQFNFICQMFCFLFFFLFDKNQVITIAPHCRKLQRLVLTGACSRSLLCRDGQISQS